MTSFSIGASETISFEIPVMSSIKLDIGCNGFIKVQNLVVALPPSKRIAATSIGRSFATSRPVVSKSKAMNLSSSKADSSSGRSI